VGSMEKLFQCCQSWTLSAYAVLADPEAHSSNPQKPVGPYFRTQTINRLTLGWSLTALAFNHQRPLKLIRGPLLATATVATPITAATQLQRPLSSLHVTSSACSIIKTKAGKKRPSGRSL
jgi:hypothetical protein